MRAKEIAQAMHAQAQAFFRRGLAPSVIVVGHWVQAELKAHTIPHVGTDGVAMLLRDGRWRLYVGGVPVVESSDVDEMFFRVYGDAA